MADSLNQKKKRGRPKLTDSERKNRHDARKRTERKARVHLGSEIHRWNYIKNRNGLKSDREVATFLIDRFVLIFSQGGHLPLHDILRSSGVICKRLSSRVWGQLLWNNTRHTSCDQQGF